MRSREGDNDRWHVNPSFGLGVWGPLVPASDCWACLATCTGLQFLAGMALWWLPGRNPPVTRSRWQNRGVKLFGALSGTYLMFFAVMEGLRLALPYDPWVEDARAARRRMPAQGIWSTWFGPRGYKAVPFEEWRERLVLRSSGMDPRRVALIQKEIERMTQNQEQLQLRNREMGNNILAQIAAGEFHHEPIGGDDPVEVDEDIDVDKLEFQELDHWARFGHIAPFNLVIIPPSRGSVDANASSGNITVHMSYAPVPETVPKI